MTRRVLVTGGSGFIGTRLIAMLAAQGYAVDAPTRARLDLGDTRCVAEYLTRTMPDAIVHLASPAMQMLRSSDDAMIAREVATTQGLACNAKPGARFIQAGSMAEYGRSGRHAERDPCVPITLYGRAKHAAAVRLHEIAKTRTLDTTVARIFGAYGHGERPNRLFQHLLAQASGKDSIALSDGSQRRDFVHVDDVCTALSGLLRHTAPLLPTYNIGTGAAITVRSAVERIAREAGIAPDRLAFGAIARSPLDEDCLEADTARLSFALGWIPPQRFHDDRSMIPLLR